MKNSNARTQAAPAVAATRPSAILVAGLFVLSGVGGLVYEVVWSRHLQLLFGVSTFAITTVIAAYMAGLALGSGIVGRLADRLTPSGAVTGYGVLELVIGVFAFLFAPLLHGVEAVYRAITPDSVAARVSLQFVLSLALLMIPTILMGGTLPLISRFFATASGRTGRGFGWAYALNTAGAVGGVFLAGFYLLEHVGLQASLLTFGTVNLAIGVIAISAGRRHAPLRRPRVQQDPTSEVRQPDRRFLLLAAIGGFVSLGCEIAWIRGFASLMLSTTYTFSLVLIVYLIGIALGSAIGARIRPSSGVLAWVFALLGAACLSQLLLYETCHDRIWHIAGDDARPFGDLLLNQALLIAIVVLPLPLLSGAALALIVGRYSQDIEHAGRDVGRIYIANTIGSVLGTALVGFVMLPLFGTFATCRALAATALLGVVLTRSARSFAWVGAIATITLMVIAAPGPKRRAMSPIYLGSREIPIGKEHFESRAPYEILDWRSGLTADVAVTTAASSGQRALWINGMPNASTYSDLITQFMISVIPFAYAKNVADCLHIGLGSGVTAGVWAELPETRRVRVVELEGQLWEAARSFAPYHFGLHTAPNVEFIADDARSFLEVAGEASHDVIISEPSQLWAKGVGNLFTTEFFAAARRALREDGLFVTWMMAYSIPDEVWAIGAATLAEQFEHVACFTNPTHAGDVFFVCSQRELRFQPERWRQLMEAKGRARWIARGLELSQPDDLARFYLGHGAALRKRIQGALDVAGTPTARNTDDLPVLEHLYPRFLTQRTTVDLIAQLYRDRYRPQANGVGAFAMPPGLAATTPRDRTLWVMTGQSGVNPLPHLVGIDSFESKTIDQLLRLPERQRGWAFATAVRLGKDRLAQRLVGSLDEQLRAEPHVAIAVGTLADRIKSTLDPAFVARFGPADETTPDKLVLALLAAHGRLFESNGDRSAAKRYVDAFLAGFPVQRLIISNPPSRAYYLLRKSALACGREHEVLRYFESVRAFLSWTYSTAGLQHIGLLVDMNRVDEARQLLRDYDSWTFAGNSILNELRKQLADSSRPLDRENSRRRR